MSEEVNLFKRIAIGYLYIFEWCIARVCQNFVAQNDVDDSIGKLKHITLATRSTRLNRKPTLELDMQTKKGLKDMCAPMIGELKPSIKA